ncbi:MAG TPA: magnesium/cobalt transporter CorA [Anaerolineae bacterium]|nr:magnesium/cobalt transporter CorA [Anaerolineae bacterium]HOQ97745.1 magnesium/cobalt transporter CorA [Anaerolineae bacterium]HPL29549.1 magnesium/cobalt transporter CorA [Anaerolineae bacterium]
MIRATICDGTGLHPVDPSAPILRAALAKGDGTLWVDLDEASDAEAAFLGEVFGFHPLAIEDALGHVEHPKLDDYGGYLYIVAHGLDRLGSDDGLHVLELDLFLGANYLVTHHHEPLHCIKVIWDRAQREERYFQRGADGLAHAVLDLLVDDLMPVLDSLDATIEELEDEILAKPTQRTLTRILDVKRATMHLRRTAVPQREVVHRLSHNESPLVRPKIQLYFRDVYDHLVRVVDISDSLRDLAAGALETYLSVVSNRMNEVMKWLTAVTTIFMPLTLLAGIYGMNFRHMPELEWRYGYVGLLAVMAVTAAAMAYWFKRRGWM